MAPNHKLSLRDFHVATGGLRDELPRGPTGPREDRPQEGDTHSAPHQPPGHGSRAGAEAQGGCTSSGSPPSAGDGGGAAGYSLRPHTVERRPLPPPSPQAAADASSPAGHSWRAGHGGEPGGGPGGGGGQVGSSHSGGSLSHQVVDVSDAHGLHRRRRSDDLCVALESPQRHAPPGGGGGHTRGLSSGGATSAHVAGAPRDLLAGMGGLSVGAAPAVTVLRRGGGPGAGSGSTGEQSVHSSGTQPPATWQATQQAAPAVLAAPPVATVPPPSSLPGEPPLPPTWPPPPGQLKLTPQQLADVLELKAAKIQAQAVAAAAAAQEAKVAAAVASGGVSAVASPAHVQPHSDTHAPPPVPPGPPPASAFPAAPVAMQVPAAPPPGKPTAPRSALVDPFPGTGAHTAPVTVPIAVCGPASAAASAHPSAATATTSGAAASSSAYASVTAGVISASTDRHGRFTALLGPTGQAHPAKSTPTQQPPSCAPSAASAASGTPGAPAPAPAAAPPSFHTVLVCAPVVEPIASSPVLPPQQQASVRPAPSPGGLPGGGSASMPPLPPGPPPPGQPRVAVAESVVDGAQQAFTDAGPGGALPKASPPQLLPRTVTTGGVTTPALVPRTHSAVRARGPSADDSHVSSSSSSSHRVAPHRPIGSQPPGMPHGGGGGAHGAPLSVASVHEAPPGASADPDGWRMVGVPKRRVSTGRHAAEREALPEAAVPWLGTAPTPAWQPAPAAGNGHAASNGGAAVTSDKA